MAVVGLIGAGNMGGAIVKGALEKGFLQANKVVIYDVNPDQIASFQKEYAVLAAESCGEVADRADYVILAVKPVYLAGVLSEIYSHVRRKKLISIAAGWSVEMLTDALNGSGAQILRVMPNTPALVGAGYTALCEETTFDAEALGWAKALFANLGVAQVLPERLFDAVVAVSGSSPAYAFMFIEAMADAAVKLGMPRKMAIEAAAQAVYGSAKMVLVTQTHPAVLKDNVCSPGGTTIEAVECLEKMGFRGAVMQAMGACAKKNQLMSDQQNGGSKQ